MYSTRLELVWPVQIFLKSSVASKHCLQDHALGQAKHLGGLFHDLLRLNGTFQALPAFDHERLSFAPRSRRHVLFSNPLAVEIRPLVVVLGRARERFLQSFFHR